MKTKRRTSIIAGCSLALCVLPNAFADKHADKHFRLLDQNGDGKITRAEHAAGAKTMFAQSDKNGDGIVTAAEMDAAMAAQGVKPDKDDKSSAEKIRVIDKNGDGKLTAAEHAAGTETMFDKMDTNRDGILTKEECDAGMKMMKKGT
jgi:Ca2+-binding EF-hand superfamily protein